MNGCASVEMLNSSFTKITTDREAGEPASKTGLWQLTQMVFKIFSVHRVIKKALRTLRKQISGNANCEVYDICACADRLNSKERAEALALWSPWNKISNETTEYGQKCLQSLINGAVQCDNDGNRAAAWILRVLAKKYNEILDSLDEIEFVTEEYIAALKAKG
ncbi:MAG: hypothetical protein IKT09_02775 [Synergistes sp.]|nr:hypothetical protein [Synergistes sp.]